MGSRPFFSIIIPVYNVAPYLSQCLDSCMNQTFSDLEIICIDDGSTDESRSILKEYMAKDSRLWCVLKQNAGVSAARNDGIRCARGSYVLFLDADDFLEDTALEVLSEALPTSPVDLMVFGSAPYPDEADTPVWYRNALTTKAGQYEDLPQILFREPGSIPFIWNKVYSLSFLRQKELYFDESVDFGEDMLFLFSVFPYAKSVCFLENKLHHYRWNRSASAMEAVHLDSELKVERNLEIAEGAAQLWEANGFLARYRADFFAWVLDFLVWETDHLPEPARTRLIGQLIALIQRHDLLSALDLLDEKAKHLWNVLEVYV